MAINEPLLKIEEKHKGLVSEYFSTTVRFWEKVYEGGLDYELRYSIYSMTKRKDTVLRLLDDYAGTRALRVLDAGCGPGVVLEEVSRRGHMVTGLDISAEMVAEANKRLVACRHGCLPCRIGDIEDLPFEDGSFDVVLCLGVLMYLPSDHKSLCEISRVLRPGGIMLLALPNLARLNMLFDPYYYFRAARYAWRWLSGRGPVRNASFAAQDFSSNEQFTNRRYLRGRLRKLLGRHDFTEIGIVGVDYSPFTIWGKPLFSMESSITFSERLAEASCKKGFGWLTALANQWVVCTTRT